MLNFSVGPVLMDEQTKTLGAAEVPYFRTKDFSKLMLENEVMLRELACASSEDRLITLTGSGTLAMDATVANCFEKSDKLLIINGGSFGQRFCEIATCYGIPFDELKLEFGETLTEDHFTHFDLKSYTALLVNADETSSGVLYDLQLLGNICQRNSLFFVVDAISAFLADEIRFTDFNIDILIIGSQKALSLPPGISLILCSKIAQDRINSNTTPVYYQNLRKALQDGERGQTPFTPAVGIIIQLHEKLARISKEGALKQIEKISALATYFRDRIQKYDFEFVTTAKSNAVTALYVPTNVSAQRIFSELESRFNIWVCPNGGTLSDKVFRVGHIGNVSTKDYDQLFDAFDQLKREGIIK